MSAALEVTTELTTFDAAGSFVRVEFRPESPAEREARRLQLLAEAEAWRLIAARVEGWSSSQCPFLCAWLTDDFPTYCRFYRITPLPPSQMRTRMLARVKAELAAGRMALDSDEGESVTTRALLCCLFAAIADDEARELTPKRSPAKSAVKGARSSRPSSPEKSRGVRDAGKARGGVRA